MRTRALPLVLTLACIVAATGCSRKPPQTTPPPAAPTPTVVTPAAPAPPPTSDPTPPELPRDLVELNALLERQGLLGDVYFDFDSANLSEEARERLVRNGRFLAAHAEYQVAIEGHCDERGTNEYNLALGELRAAAAAGYLTNLGAGGDRLRTVSFGEEKPQCGDSGEPCWQRNRRAHFVIVGRAEG